MVGWRRRYDITNPASFHSIDSWVQELRENAEVEVMCLLGNKTDLREGIAGDTVSAKDGREYAQRIGALFFETSAKDSTGVSEAFLHVAKKLLQHQRGVCMRLVVVVVAVALAHPIATPCLAGRGARRFENTCACALPCRLRLVADAAAQQVVVLGRNQRLRRRVARSALAATRKQRAPAFSAADEYADTMHHKERGGSQREGLRPSAARAALSPQHPRRGGHPRPCCCMAACVVARGNRAGMVADVAADGWG